jgi:geranylgeranyl diphosphate synthase type I
VIDRFGGDISGGKMLRARLVLHVAPAAGVPRPAQCRAAAAVEMLQSASLLHDDVVDGGTERRGRPALWVSEGAKAAVLVGDLLVGQAVGFIQGAMPDVMPVLVSTMQEMCDAEVEQEFRLFHEDASWSRCVGIARRKTGSLFGLAARCAAGADPDLAKVLLDAGYAIGTAYQLADDLLDTSRDAGWAGKSLGTDARTGKLTAASSCRGGGPDPAEYVANLLQTAGRDLDRWPAVNAAWTQYAERVVAPVIEQFTACASV